MRSLHFSHAREAIVIKNSSLFSDLTEIERLFIHPDAAPWESLQAMVAFMERCAASASTWPKSMPCCIHATKMLPTRTQSVFSEKPITCRGGWDLVVDESVVIHGPVFIGRGVKIRKGAAIIGPAYIGDGVTIGNSRVKQCIIRSGVTIKEDGVVTVRDGAVIQSYVRLRNSVIGRGVRIFPNAVVNDERITAREVEIYDGEGWTLTSMEQYGLAAGDHAIIGGGSIAYPGAIVASDARVEHGTMLFPKIYEGHITNPSYNAFMNECGR